MMGSFQDPDCTVFVSNVDNQVTPEHLWELFLQAGPLRNVHIPTDKKTGKNRTFAFVSYRHQCSVPYACELFNTLRLFKRPIYCKPTKESSNQNSESPSRSPNPVNHTNDAIDVSCDSYENTPHNRSHDQRRSYDSRDSQSRNVDRGFPANRFGAHMADNYSDTPRNRYNNSSRDHHNDHSRDYHNETSRDSRYNSNENRSNSPFQQGRSGDKYDNYRYSPNSPASPKTSQPSPLFLKAVSHIRNKDSPERRRSPSNFGSMRRDSSYYSGHRQNRRHQSDPY